MSELQAKAAKVINQVTGKPLALCEHLASKMDPATQNKLVEAKEAKDRIVEAACGPILAEAAKDPKGGGLVYQGPKTSVRTPDKASHAAPGGVTAPEPPPAE